MTRRGIDGHGGTMTGNEVMDRVGEVLVDLLPRVPIDDPFRPALDLLAVSANIDPGRALRVVR